MRTGITSPRRRLARSAVAGSLVIATLIATALPALADDHSATQQQLNTYQAQNGPGAAVFAGDRTGSWNLSSGTGIVGTNAPIQPNQHFRIGSQTKTFTAAVVLQLADEGKVSLDTPIEQYLPGVVDGNGYDGSKITVRQLLQHTGGIADANPASFLTTTLAQVVQTALANHAPVSAPGTQINYSNIDYWILGMLIEKVTGMSARDAITDRIITPLGLTQTRFPAAGDLSVGAPAVHGYANVPLVGWTDISNINGTLLGTGFVDEPSEWSTAGAMISTLTDLTTFYQALVDGKVISTASLAEMETPTPLPGNGQNYYGLGLGRMPLSCGGNAWGHNGDLNGYTSGTYVTADGRHASVVANGAAGNVDLRYKVADSALCSMPAN